MGLKDPKYKPTLWRFACIIMPAKVGYFFVFLEIIVLLGALKRGLEAKKYNKNAAYSPINK